jgi:Uma2 family endonuclease
VIPYEAGWPANHPSRALLVVEVADSSLRYDRGEKALLYSISQVDEYWIVDIDNGLVEVRRDRHDGEWRSLQTFHRGDTLAMQAFPDVTIAVAEILPPA